MQRILTVPAFFDAHVHLRDGALMESLTKYVVRYAQWAIVMPNLTPPVSTGILVNDYRNRINGVLQRQRLMRFAPLMTIKLLPGTTPKMIEFARQMNVFAAKLYPEGVTVNAEDGIKSFDAPAFLEVLAEMERQHMVLCIHGELPGTSDERAESAFMFVLRRIVAQFPSLRIVLEHVSTAEGVETVKALGDNVVATITAHHLILTEHDVPKTPHNLCKPVAKTLSDREALWKVILSGHPRFFFGSDSAPHPRVNKESPPPGKRPAFGVFTAPILPELLVTHFEERDALHLLPNFATHFGRSFYGLSQPVRELSFVRGMTRIQPEYDGVVPLLAGHILPWQLTANS